MKIKKLCALMAACSLSVSLLFSVPTYAEEIVPATETPDAVSLEIPDPGITTNELSGWPEGPDITSRAGVVMEESTGIVLYGKNMDTVLVPGSTVKIMTMLLALENSQLTDEVTMTATGVSGVTDGGVSISSQLGEVFTMEQCMYAIMLKSANDIALQVAEHIGGSLDGFVKMMNDRAAELGCTNTVFTNPTGLPDPDQQTSAYDMALIMRAAMENSDFRNIISAQGYTIPATNMAGGERAMTNSFKMSLPADPLYYPECLGGKLGVTNASGETLVCAAKKNDLTLICVVLKGAVDFTPIDATSILNYSYNSFHMLDLGREDFDVLEGGIVLAPVTAVSDDFTTEDVENENGELNRTYFFKEMPVGTATCIKPAKEEQVINTDSEKHLAEAEAYSHGDDYTPYLIIGGIGLLLVLFLFIRMIKVIRS